MTPDGSGTNGTRRDLLRRYHAALTRTHAARIARVSLANCTGPHALVALGKAAAAFADGAATVDGLALTHTFTAGPRGYGSTQHAGGHPLPDDASLAAGDALVDWFASLPPGLPLIAFVSGGASACIERLRPGWTLDRIAARTRELIASGAAIDAINAERARWSLLKHGGMLALAGARPVEALVMSDVPGDDPAVVGSGPFVGAPTRVVAANADALDAVGATVVPGVLSGDAAEQGAAIARFLRDAAPGLYAWGGETTVTLPASPGRGGRCQQLALAAAIALEETTGITLLAAATDGVDGASDDAGAIVDGTTAQAIRDDGLDPARALARCDANPALAAAGALLHTGPTGTNVMDLVIARHGGSGTK